MRNPAKIFARSEEQYLNAIILYADSNSYLCLDSAKEKKASKDVVVNAFKKGILLINDGTGFVRPTSLAISTAYASVSYTTVGSQSAAVATTFYSDGYSAG